MSAPVGKLKEGWSLITKGFNLDDPADVLGQSYLGCQQDRWAVDLPGGGKGTVDCENMQDYMKSCVQLYTDLAPVVALSCDLWSVT